MAQCEKHILIKVLFVLLLVVALLSPATAQQKPSTAPEPDATAKESLRIGPGDLLHITIYDEPALEQRARVNDAGEVSLSMIGSVKVAGEPPFDAAGGIRKKYVTANLFKNPQVFLLVEG